MESYLYRDSPFIFSLSLVIIRPGVSRPVHALSHVLCSHSLCLWESWEAVVIRTDSGAVLFCRSFHNMRTANLQWPSTCWNCPGLWDRLHKFARFRSVLKVCQRCLQYNRVEFGTFKRWLYHEAYAYMNGLHHCHRRWLFIMEVGFCEKDEFSRLHPCFF